MKSQFVARIASAAASDNATLVRAGPCLARHITGYNAAVAVRYLKLYNKATAPTIGTDTPVMTIALGPSAAFNIALPEQGLYFSLGLGLGMVTAAADNSTAALTAADVVGLNVVYNAA